MFATTALVFPKLFSTISLFILFVATKFNVVLLMGDNLIDFLDVFRKKTIDERYSSIDSLKIEFGKRFIILPNPMYGEWEKTIYGGTTEINSKKKQKLRIEVLRKN